MVRPCLMDHQSLLKEIFLKGWFSFLENISNKHPQITMTFTCFIWSIPSNSYEISLWKFIFKLIACPLKHIPFTRRLCDTVFLDGFQHITCSSTGDLRTYRWNHITSSFDVGLHLSADLCIHSIVLPNYTWL